jgi:hypothetical protein
MNPQRALGSPAGIAAHPTYPLHAAHELISDTFCDYIEVTMLSPGDFI